MTDKIYSLGDVYIEPNGCPQCQSDLEVTHGVAVMCVNWQHPNIPTMFRENGKRNCNYAILSG